MEKPIRYELKGVLHVEELTALFAQTDWAQKRKSSDIEQMLEKCDLYMTARAGGTLVGFARALTDGCYRAFIEDVIVVQHLRGRGIGDKMLSMLMSELDKVEVVALNCIEQRTAFYQRLGFERSDTVLMSTSRMKEDQ